MYVSIQKRHKWQPSSLKQSTCASYRLSLYRLCKDEREKLGEKQQKGRHRVTLIHNNLLKSSLTLSWVEAGERALTPALLSRWQLAPRCWCPLPSPKGAHCPAPRAPAPPPCPLLPTQLLMHFSGGGSHHCLVSLLLVNNLVLFANKHKVLFKEATFSTSDIAHHAVYQGSS